MELKKNLLKMTVLVIFTLSFHPLRKWFSEMGMCSLSDFVWFKRIVVHFL